MIDIHCHILPGMDDGPDHLETSLSMARIAAGDGIGTIIATPHTDGIRVNRESVPDRVHDLNRELKRHHIDLAVLPGYEIPYHLLSELAPTHTLAGSNYVLIEFPHAYVPGDAPATVFRLLAQGFIPIIAHPERNRDILRNPDLLENLIEAGALSQLTAVSITGDLGPDIQQCAHSLLVRKMAHFIATDSQAFFLHHLRERYLLESF